MKVYHGSTEIVDIPLISKGRRNLDFGQGFYLTDIKQQAIDWAMRPINNGKSQYINCYNFDIEVVQKDSYRCIRFSSYNDSWLDFVIANRHGNVVAEYDVVEGGIANERVFNTIELFDSGLITREEALSRLRYEKPNNQICILNQSVIDKYLHFDSALILNGDGE